MVNFVCQFDGPRGTQILGQMLFWVGLCGCFWIYGGSDSKESACNAGDSGLIPGSGRCPGEGNGYPLQYSCLGNPMDRVAIRLQLMGSQRVGHN